MKSRVSIRQKEKTAYLIHPQDENIKKQRRDMECSLDAATLGHIAAIS